MGRQRVDRAEAECHVLQKMATEKESEMKALREREHRLAAALSQKNAECEQFRTLNEQLAREYKQMSKDFALCKTKCAEMEQAAKVLDPSKYRQWTPRQVVDWMVSLQPKFKKYKLILQPQFEKEGVDGMALQYVDKPSLLGWGVECFMDRVLMEKGIQRLMQSNDNTFRPRSPSPPNESQPAFAL